MFSQDPGAGADGRPVLEVSVDLNGLPCHDLGVPIGESHHKIGVWVRHRDAKGIGLRSPYVLDALHQRRVWQARPALAVVAEKEVGGGKATSVDRRDVLPPHIST